MDVTPIRCKRKSLEVLATPQKSQACSGGGGGGGGGGVLVVLVLFWWSWIEFPFVLHNVRMVLLRLGDVSGCAE